MDQARRRYFAYGSNLCTEQMALRCPAADRGEIVHLPAWRFVINRRGVATILPDDDATVIGLIWHLTEECEATLDEYEGVEFDIYRKESIEIGGAPALIYVASEERLGRPRPGYLERILSAAERLGIDADYRSSLATWGVR